MTTGEEHAGTGARTVRAVTFELFRAQGLTIATGYGCHAARITDLDALKQAVATAWTRDVPTVLEIPISPQIPPLI